MKSSNLFKMLVVAFALQGSQLLSLPVMQSAEGTSYETIKNQLSLKGDDALTKQARKALILRLLSEYEADRANGNVLAIGYVAQNFDLNALKAEVQWLPYLKRSAANAGSSLRSKAVNGAVAVYNAPKAATKYVKSNPRRSAAAAIAAAAAVAAYYNRDAVIAKARNLANSERAQNLSVMASNARFRVEAYSNEFMDWARSKLSKKAVPAAAAATPAVVAAAAAAAVPVAAAPAVVEVVSQGTPLNQVIEEAADEAVAAIEAID